MNRNLLISLIGIMAFGLLASCEKNEIPQGPLNDGSGVRSQIVVISDIHLGVDSSKAEFNHNRQALVDFLAQVQKSPTVRELVIAGDLLDEWYISATVDTYAGKNQADYVHRIATGNPEVIGAFMKIIREKKITVTYVPGNHDLTITAANVESILPGIKQARDDVQGLGTYNPVGYPVIAIEHGHRFNFFCAPDQISNSTAAPGSILPPGYFYARVATLHVAQHCTIPGDTIPAVTPNLSGGESQATAYTYWRVWKSLLTSMPVENKFSEKIIVTNIGGFTETYSIDDLLPHQETPGGYIDMNLYKSSFDTWDDRQTRNHVLMHISVNQAIAQAADDRATDAEAARQYFTNPASDYRIVIFGHTHQARLIPSQNLYGLKTIYANSGTWIDHNPSLTIMNFVVITPQRDDATSQTQVKVCNFMGEVMTEMTADSLRL